ncbi:MAG: lytic transglycosylase domain-containing protein [Patescibacteria group bacterium]|nr:lytic transglycosylase domain-containing protein [Patescibacteria group bacterium]
MFTQIVSTYETFSTGTVTIKAYIYKFAKRNAQKISAFMMASKMLSVMMLFVLVPLNSPSQAQNTKKQDVAEVKLDQASPIAVTGKNRQVAIATGQSNLDLAKQSTSSKAVSYSPSQSVERDPSYFRGLYQRAGAAYNVPWQLIEAVHYVETGASDSTTESSYAGAVGPMQFMPGTWRTYGVDANGDGVASINNVDDAVFGAANLLAQGGAAEGDYQSALFNYNHAQWYVDKVMGIARDAGMQ